MQDWEMPEADQERYLDQAFAIAQIIQDKIIEISFELPKEDKERCLMAREDRAAECASSGGGFGSGGGASS